MEGGGGEVDGEDAGASGRSAAQKAAQGSAEAERWSCRKGHGYGLSYLKVPPSLCLPLPPFLRRLLPPSLVAKILHWI